MSPEDQESRPDAPTRTEADAEHAIREILDLLPSDVRQELNSGQLDLHDPAFLDGLADHVSRLSLADPREGRHILRKIIKLKKLISRDLRSSDPEVVVSSTLTRNWQHVGRNVPCPCGSGKKFKHCCLHKR